MGTASVLSVLVGGVIGAVCFVVLTFLINLGVALWSHVFSARSPWRTFSGWSQPLRSTWRCARTVVPLGFVPGAVVSIFGWLALAYLAGMIMGAFSAFLIAATYGMLMALIRRIMRRREPKEQKLRWDVVDAAVTGMGIPLAPVTIVVGFFLTLAVSLTATFMALLYVGLVTIEMLCITLYVKYAFDVDEPNSASPAK